MIMIALVTIILLVAVILLVTEIVPVDVTAFGIIVVLTVFGILTPTEAVSGFASPAVLTVAAMFMISRGMIRTGAVGFLGQYLFKLSKGHPVLAMVLILGVVGIASAFINNTPIVVLFIPIVLSITCKLGLSPSKYLIPISYISILGGTCTLVGTSTNIIVSDLSTAHGTGPIMMFELAVLGVPIALIGFFFLLMASPKWMPDTLNSVCELENHDNRRYLAEFNVPTDSLIVGNDPIPFFKERYPSLEVIDLIRYDHVFHPRRDHMTVAPDDILLIKSSANDLVDILHEDLVDLPLSEAGIDFSADQQASLIVELIVPPESTLIGNRLIESRLSRETDLHVIAIKRRELHYTEAKMQDVRLKTGDILLVRCPESTLEDFRSDTDFIIVEDVHHEIIHKRLALRAAVIFAAMVAAASSGLADILVCAMTAAFLMIVCKCLPLRDAYRAIESRVLMIIIGTIALSAALEKTGASNLYAHAFLNLFADASPAVVLCGIVLLTSVSTQVLSNNATAVLLFPIALATAQGLGVSSKPFIVAICFGASACFATPIGYQTNLLVYGPGGYRFTDYLRLGIPLNVLVLVMGSVFIPMFWPF
jgi:di/tricarboxylate transporter